MGKVVNKAELELILGVSHTTLTEWQEQGLPIQARGARGQENAYDVPAVIAWMIEREVRKVRARDPRTEGLELDNKLKAMDVAEREGKLVPVTDIEPTWKYRVLSAAAFLAGQHSRLAGILEATPGVDAKRRVLREEFAQFLNRLGVDGARMQNEVEWLLARVSETEAADFLRRISAHDDTPDAARGGGEGVAPVRPAEEGPAVGVG